VARHTHPFTLRFDVGIDAVRHGHTRYRRAGVCATTVKVNWPASAAGKCALWLRDLLR
jgi:hypothetical protein